MHGSEKKLKERSAAAKKSMLAKTHVVDTVEADNNSSTDDWIAEASHELRLPVANIRLLIETLLSGALEDEKTAKKMLSTVHAETMRLQSLLTNLLSVERLSNSRYELVKEWLFLEPRVSHAFELTAAMASEAKVRVQINIEPDFRIYANAAQLDQVLLNLLENSIKFTLPGGSVLIASERTEGRFSIADTGIGMPESEIPKIFQRFYRIDRSKNRGGTGLGLSIVKYILDAHNAKITINSKQGQGSSFLLEFPSPGE